MMKLSEAILLGSVGTEQGYGPNAIMPNNGKTCALGAALFAVQASVVDWSIGMKAVADTWPLTAKFIPYPDALRAILRLSIEARDSVYAIVWRLNDIAKWTRPQIAAWVAELEKVYDPDPVPVAAPVQDAVEVQ